MIPNSQKKMREAALTITRWVGSLPSIVLHTIIFVGCFVLATMGFFAFDKMLLVLTTIVSLEAIYLAIFIQMTINYTSETLEEVEQDIDEIQENVDELQEDVEEMSEEDKEKEKREVGEKHTLDEIHAGLKKLMEEVEELQKRS